MSKGYGKWQRLILEAVNEHNAVWINSLLPINHNKSDYSAITRAAKRLINAGKINGLVYPGQRIEWDDNEGFRDIKNGNCRSAAIRIGYNPPSRESIISVECSSESST